MGGPSWAWEAAVKVREMQRAYPRTPGEFLARTNPRISLHVRSPLFKPFQNYSLFAATAAPKLKHQTAKALLRNGSNFQKTPPVVSVSLTPAEANSFACHFKVGRHHQKAFSRIVVSPCQCCPNKHGEPRAENCEGIEISTLCGFCEGSTEVVG